MSFRELRDFTEMMRSLGYRRRLSVENFRTPNFELVADLLYWLTLRYEPHATLSDDISDKERRVEFLKSVAQIMQAKARVRLSIKQLYRADGYAVKELLKVASLLYDAMKVEQDESMKIADVAVGDRLEGMQEARALSTEIVESGSRLYDLLGREGELKPARDGALRFLDSLSLNLDNDDPQKLIERNIRQQINNVDDNMAGLERMVGELQRDQTALQSKIERKSTEMERAEKRLKSLKKVRPAFMEEYERLEAELRQVHEAYTEKYRNLHYLESELAKFHAAEADRRRQTDRALRRMQRRLQDEEMRVQRGGEDSWADGTGDNSYRGTTAARAARPGGADARNRGRSARRPSAPARGRRVEGDVDDGDEDDEDDGWGARGGGGGAAEEWEGGQHRTEDSASSDEDDSDLDETDDSEEEDDDDIDDDDDESDLDDDSRGSGGRARHNDDDSDDDFF